MSAHAYSEPYSYDRRHARHQLRNTTPVAAPRKAAAVVQLVPRDYSREKQIELVYPKYKGALGTLALALIVGLHFAVFAYFYFNKYHKFFSIFWSLVKRETLKSLARSVLPRDQWQILSLA